MAATTNASVAGTRGGRDSTRHPTMAGLQRIPPRELDLLFSGRVNCACEPTL